MSPGKPESLGGDGQGQWRPNPGPDQSLLVKVSQVGDADLNPSPCPLFHHQFICTILGALELLRGMGPSWLSLKTQASQVYFSFSL